MAKVWYAEFGDDKVREFQLFTSKIAAEKYIRAMYTKHLKETFGVESISKHLNILKERAYQLANEADFEIAAYHNIYQVSINSPKVTTKGVSDLKKEGYLK